VGCGHQRELTSSSPTIFMRSSVNRVGNALASQAISVLVYLSSVNRVGALR
jgi:hypothetical protein